MENCGNTKKINFQFHHRKFSQQMHSILSYYNQRGKRGTSLLYFFENWKKGSCIQEKVKRWTDFGHLCVKFLKMFPSSVLFFLPSQSNLKENYGSTESINFNYLVQRLVSKDLSFYYTVIFTGLSMTKAIDGSFHGYQQSPRDALKYFSESTGKHLCQSFFFQKIADLRPGAFLKISHFDRGLFL